MKTKKNILSIYQPCIDIHYVSRFLGVRGAVKLCFKCMVWLVILYFFDIKPCNIDELENIGSKCI